MERVKKLLGKQIYLSPHLAEDAEQLYRWRNDLSLTEQLGSPTRLSSLESEIEGIQTRTRGEDHHFSKPTPATLKFRSHKLPLGEAGRAKP